ncbi:MAG: hypothetical protein CL723_04880 [Chloroflexi bacterium]|nr:hypothetical protein [Chloroflexota bacterium]
MNKIEHKLFCRKATLKDMRLYYNWTNEPKVRKNSLNNKYISWNFHKNWFKKKMRSKKTVLYVFEKKDVAVGQVRFDRKNKIVKLSFSICKSFRERGFGKKMVTMAIKKYRLNKKITFIGEVKPKNFSSIKIFKSLGFTMDFINKIYRFKKICV